ncbi:hypothetical protein HYQ46_006604 [Verticillium longisporum]|nr:hypothetical protein HYQ46_006604 [Verticillium longisporum]
MLLGSSLRRVHGNGKVVLFLFVILSRGKKTTEHKQLANGRTSSVAALDEPAQREANAPFASLLLIAHYYCSCSLAPATCPHLFLSSTHLLPALVTINPTITSPKFRIHKLEPDFLSSQDP